MPKRKKMTVREKKLRAELRRRWKAEGIIPPDKPRLNRKKFIEESKNEWHERCYSYIWEHYLTVAIMYMLTQTEGTSMRNSLEAVGVAKVLKVAIRLKQFEEELKEKGEKDYKITDQYDYIKDILEA